MTLKEVKEEIKALGYKVRVKTYSDFKAIKVIDPETATEVNAGNVYSPEHLAKYKTYFDWLNSKKRSIQDNNYRCVL